MENSKSMTIHGIAIIMFCFPMLFASPARARFLKDNNTTPSISSCDDSSTSWIEIETQSLSNENKKKLLRCNGYVAIIINNSPFSPSDAYATSLIWEYGSSYLHNHSNDNVFRKANIVGTHIHASSLGSNVFMEGSPMTGNYEEFDLHEDQYLHHGELDAPYHLFKDLLRKDYLVNHEIKSITFLYVDADGRIVKVKGSELLEKMGLS